MSDPSPFSPASSLLAWLAARGACFPAAAPQPIPGMGWGLTASRALDPEDTILCVPRDLWLTRKTGHTGYRPLLDAAQARDVFGHGMSRLALLVALERATPGSFFRPYLDALAKPTVPYHLTAEERTAIQGLPLGAWIDEQRTEVEQEYADLCAMLRAHAPDVAAARALDLERWLWATGHVMQRTFTVDVEDEEVWVLVPGMDLCNHASDPNAVFFAEEDGWYLEAARPIEQDEQITIRYGRAKTSSDLLLYYGFVTPDNPHDRLHLQLELPAGDPDETEKRAAIDVLGLETETLLGPEGTIPSPFLHAAILWGLDSATFRADRPDVADPARAVAALERTAAAIDDARAAFPTSVDEDVSILAESPASGWLRALVAYRSNVKRLHRTAAAGIRRRIQDMAAHGWRPTEFVPEDPDGRYGLATVRVTA